VNIAQCVKHLRVLQKFHEDSIRGASGAKVYEEYHKNSAEVCRFSADWLLSLRCRKSWGSYLTSKGTVGLTAWLDKSADGSVEVAEFVFDSEPSPNAKTEALWMLSEDRAEWYERGSPCCG